MVQNSFLNVRSAQHFLFLSGKQDSSFLFTFWGCAEVGHFWPVPCSLSSVSEVLPFILHSVSVHSTITMDMLS